MNLLSAHILKVFVALIPIATLILGCDREKSNQIDVPSKLVYYCDAEKVEKNGGSIIFKSEDSITFLGGEARCEGCGINGSAGIELNETNVYGMNILLEDLEPGEYFEASIKEKDSKGNGAIIVKFTGGATYNLASDKNLSASDENGWSTLSLKFKVLKSIDSAQFFVHSGGKQAVFDDFQIIRYAEVPILDTVFENALTIHIPEKSDNKLNGYLEYCVDAEIIPDAMKEYVDAAIIDGKDSHKVEMRLKGDWTDHIKTGFPSYRIKTDDDFAFKGLKSFSIQHPRTRNFMHEWFFHRLLESEDILTTTYEFVPLVVNDRFQGVFALEEHFDKQLLESRNRREGPILKLDESGFWSALYESNKQGFSDGIPYYQAAYPSVFKSGRTRKNPVLLGQFLNGASLLQEFKSLDYDPENIFDLNKEAKYYALMEIGNIMHGLAWHNRRFYFNPITQKLEHIAYDLQVGVMPHNPIRLNTEIFRSMNENLLPEELRLNENLFENDEFREAYIGYLEYYSSEAYLDSMFQVLGDEIEQTEKLMQLTFPDFKFDSDFYFEHCEFVRTELGAAIFELKEMDGLKSKSWSRKLTALKNVSDGIFVKDVSLNAYVKEIDSVNYKISVSNYHLADVEIIGYSNKEDKDNQISFETTYKLPSLNTGTDEKVEIVVDSEPHALFFKVANLGDSIVKKKVMKWEEPPVEISRTTLEKSFSLSNPLFERIEGELKIPEGIYTCSELIYVPNSYRLFIDAGVQIDFINGGGLITNNDTYFIGEPGKEIIITSSDSSGSGVTVLNANKVVFQYLEVSNMNTLNYNGWVLTGGVNVYESDVFVQTLSIKNAQSEDALNFIRSDFEIHNLLIDGTFSDGFDADFCDGAIYDSKFMNTGNDCVDFSGSFINGGNVEIKNSGDKAISAGEKSTVVFTDVTINGAEIAFAAKDNSELKIFRADVDQVKFGVTVFQKKPEYGPAKVFLQEINYKNLSNLGLIGLGSECEFDGSIFRGQFEVDVDQLYAKFNK